MSDTMTNLRATLMQELSTIDAELTALRAERTELAAKIKEKVQAHAELTSAINKLTPRSRSRKPPASEPVLGVVAPIEASA